MSLAPPGTGGILLHVVEMIPYDARTESSGTRAFKRPVAPATGESCRVLLVEDEVPLRRALVRTLESARHTVVDVGDGNSAVAALMKESFDVVLSDIQMSGMSGVDLLYVVRAYDLDVPVVLMTGNPSVETAAAAVEYGALRYFVKPVPTEQLLATVAQAGRLNRMAKVKRQMLTELGAPTAAAPADRAGLETRLDTALEGLTLAFQPIASARSRKAMAYEALMRSSEPSLPDPSAVLGAAERLGRLHDVGRRVRALAAETCAKLSDPDVLLFVNLHSEDLLDDQLASPEAALGRMAKRVVLEITERASLDHVPNVRDRIAKLRDIGYRIAVDDLGSGYAGLATFATLEPEFVKLDSSLVRNVDSSPVRQRLVESMVTLSTELGSRLIAEGIERVEERDTLLRLRCELFQGYLLARPGPPFPMVRW